MAKITKRVVDALKPSDKADVFAWDSELKGFGVRVKPSGTKSFLIQYRNPEGRPVGWCWGNTGLWRGTGRETSPAGNSRRSPTGKIRPRTGTQLARA
ncbi:DUF4102 domain-containing protein [Sphingomonas sp. MA1305]|uniref:integrase arm-type DNA-binding domain-containing protein n=1 Tax=Sphingomonas sp. MA1305 TaxID=2479204 RepID=UPI0018DF0D7C|nr:integrase arm-type DNA-binding domain-containing protein [Sphingomonas sp. MA1305]MBI0475617.1 DUF4102 domain-containing protein [Sphingomonas sp. MA1305]